MRTEILKHSRRIDDYIMLARKNLKDVPSTPITELIEFLLKQATEEYFSLNEAALNLPHDAKPDQAREVGE